MIKCCEDGSFVVVVQCLVARQRAKKCGASIDKEHAICVKKLEDCPINDIQFVTDPSPLGSTYTSILIDNDFNGK